MATEETREPIRVLHIVGSMHPGGIQNFIMNLYENIDRQKIQFDVILHDKTEDDYCEQIEKMGGKVYLLPRMTRKPIANLRGIKKIVREGHYNIVIRHAPNAVVAPQLRAAKKGGAKVVQCHSHSTNDTDKILHAIGKFWMNHMKIDRFACSKQAGVWMYGKRDCTVINNAISVPKFSYSEEKRAAIREEFGIGNVRFYGHVGNIVPVKNHTFLMKVYKEISLIDDTARFICVGDGELREAVEAEATELGIRDKVIFTGIRKDADAIMSALDELIFPSIHEGIPLTLIEAQIAGLPILISDTIAESVDVTKGLVNRKSLDDGAASWATEATTLVDSVTDRSCQRDRIAAAGYDIDELTAWYEDYFLHG